MVLAILARADKIVRPARRARSPAIVRPHLHARSEVPEPGGSPLGDRPVSSETTERGTLTRMSLNTLLLHPSNVRPQRRKALVDPLISPLNLPDILDGTHSIRTERSDQHRHASPNVR